MSTAKTRDNAMGSINIFGFEKTSGENTIGDSVNEAHVGLSRPQGAAAAVWLGSSTIDL